MKHQLFNLQNFFNLAVIIILAIALRQIADLKTEVKVLNHKKDFHAEYDSCHYKNDTMRFYHCDTLVGTSVIKKE